MHKSKGCMSALGKQRVALYSAVSRYRAVGISIGDRHSRLMEMPIGGGLHSPTTALSQTRMQHDDVRDRVFIDEGSLGVSSAASLEVHDDEYVCWLRVLSATEGSASSNLRCFYAGERCQCLQTSSAASVPALPRIALVPNPSQPNFFWAEGADCFSLSNITITAIV